MGFRVLDLVRPFVGLVPSIAEPKRKVGAQEKVVWTLIVLAIFFVYSQIPLYGIMAAESSSAFYWIRQITAKNRGTLMDIGTSTIITASMIIQILVTVGFLQVDSRIKEDRILQDTASNVLAVTLTVGQALVQVCTGFYGNPTELGVGVCSLLVIQLAMVGLLIILLDELSEHYGLGSGVSLFVSASVCEHIVWKTFSPITRTTDRGLEFEGAALALFSLLIKRRNKLAALREAFYRDHLPNISSLCATIFIFFVVVYVQGFRIDIPVSHKRIRSHVSNYPVGLFKSTSTPLMLQSQTVNNIFTVSQMIQSKFPSNFFTRMIGTWERSPKTRQFVASGGFCYFLMAPTCLTDALSRPAQFLVYTIFTISSCAFFTNMWAEMSGSSPRDLARHLKEQQLVLVGHREEACEKELGRVLSSAAYFGGTAMGLLSIVSDLMGSFCTGSGLLLAVTTAFLAFEKISKEIAESGGRIVLG